MRTAFIIIGILVGNLLSAQNYTYLGAELGFSTYRSQNANYPTNINFGLYNGSGSIIGFHLRRELSKMLSIETGYSSNTYGDYYLPNVAFESHQIPLKGNLNINVYRDRISTFASFGYLFCIEESLSSGSFGIWNSEGDGIVVDWSYISESKYNSLFVASSGCRFRLLDELLIEMELGYAFGLKAIREYKLTFWDTSGISGSSHLTGKGNYYYFKIGLSYPIQRASKLLEKVIFSQEIE